MRLEFLYRIRQQGMLYNLYKYLEDCQYMVWTNSRPGQSDHQGECKHLARTGSRESLSRNGGELLAI